MAVLSASERQASVAIVSDVVDLSGISVHVDHVVLTVEGAAADAVHEIIPPMGATPGWTCTFTQSGTDNITWHHLEGGAAALPGSLRNVAGGDIAFDSAECTIRYVLQSEAVTGYSWWSLSSALNDTA